MARPIAAGALTILGGLFIIAGGLVLAFIGGILAAFLGPFSGLFLLGLAVGFLTFVLGILLILLPFAHTVFGIVVVVLAFVSLPFAFGGFVLGFVLALVGGILAIAWSPPPRSPIVTVESRVVSPPPG